MLMVSTMLCYFDGLPVNLAVKFTVNVMSLALF